MKPLNIALRVSDTQLSCTMEDERTLLELLESHRIAIDYQCREGYCGACRTTLLTGNVQYVQTPLAFIQPGEILPCCCRPCGDIEIQR